MHRADVIQIVRKCLSESPLYRKVHKGADLESHPQSQWNNWHNLTIIHQLRMQWCQLIFFSLVFCGGIEIQQSDPPETIDVKLGSLVKAAALRKKIIYTYST